MLWFQNNLECQDRGAQGSAGPHVLMFHVFEEPQLPVSPLGEDLRLERSVELLDGHLGSSSGVCC